MHDSLLCNPLAACQHLLQGHLRMWDPQAACAKARGECDALDMHSVLGARALSMLSLYSADSTSSCRQQSQSVEREEAVQYTTPTPFL